MGQADGALTSDKPLQVLLCQGSGGRGSQKGTQEVHWAYNQETQGPHLILFSIS